MQLPGYHVKDFEQIVKHLALINIRIQNEQVKIYAFCGKDKKAIISPLWAHSLVVVTLRYHRYDRGSSPRGGI